MFDNILFNIVLIVLVILLLLIILFFVLFDDGKLIYWYIFKRNKLKYKLSRKLNNGDQELYILGTLHHMHKNLEEYSYQHLKAVLFNLKPDVLLIESRQEEIDKDNLLDGPIEMFYLHMAAKTLNIPVFGVDWFSYSQNKPGSTNKIRDKKITENIIKVSKGYQKVLIVIGATHMLIDEKLLLKEGFQKSSFTTKNKDLLYQNLEDSFILPKETSTYIDKRIEREKLALLNESIPLNWKQAHEKAINALQNMKKNISKER